MDNKSKLIEELVYSAPLALLGLKDKGILEEVNQLLPYSSAMEIECNISKDFPKIKSSWHGEISDVRAFNDIFKTIPNIINVDCDGCEQRYRIPNGIVGIICLYDITQFLPLHSELNFGSGIHFHVDCTDCYDHLLSNHNRLSEKYSEWILPELDTWEFGGTQQRGIFSGGSWIRLNGLKTMEFRIGNMTFDYKEILKRILHANDIVRRIKRKEGVYVEPIFKEIDTKELIKFHKERVVFNYKERNLNRMLEETNKQLEELIKEEIEAQTDIPEEVMKHIKSRSHKIY